MPEIIISCPDCEGGGKQFRYWEVTGFLCYKRERTKSEKDCERCNGLGKLLIDRNNIKKET